MERRRRKEEKVKFPRLENKFEELRHLEEEYIKLPQLQETKKVRHLKKESFERPVLPDRTQELRCLEKENLQLNMLLRLDKPRRLEILQKEQPLEDFIEKPPRKNSLPVIHRNQVGSSSSRGFRSPWQRTVDDTTAENTQEPLEKMKRHQDRHELNKQWLKACLDSLKTKTTKESRGNVLQWLQKCRKSLNGKSYQAGPSISLGTWLVNSWITFEKEHPEEFMGDVASWLEISLKHMELRGPKTRALTPEEWLDASIQAIQNPLTTEAKLQRTLRWHGKII